MRYEKFKITLLIFVLYFAYSGSLYSQIFNEDITNFTVENGLSNNKINCLYQDHTGFLWIGTGNGLNKYDGYVFTNYHSNPLDSTTLSNDIITSITEDKSGNLWLATKSGGLNKYDRNTGKFINFKHNPSNLNSISENTINSICTDDSGNIWIGTLNTGLNKFEINSQKFISYRYNAGNSQSICSDSINVVLYMGNSCLLIGTSNGLNYFDFQNNILKSYRHSDNDKNSLHNNNVCAIFKDASNGIWIGTSENGFQKFDAGSGIFTSYKITDTDENKIESFSVSSITEDKDNMLLISTTPGHGVFRFNKITGKVNVVNYYNINNEQYSERIINTLLVDRTNVLWAGTKGLGLDKINLNKKKFEYYNIASDFEKFGVARKIWSVFNDREDNIWLGTLDGLMLFNRKDLTTKTFHIKNGIETKVENITSITQDRNGYLWLGTWGGGLIKFDIKYNKFTAFTSNPNKDNSINSNYIRTIYQDKEGLLWIGTGGRGINIFDPVKEEFRKFPIKLNDSNNSVIYDISAIYEDRNGDIWIGTYAEGLIRYNKSKDVFFRYRNDARNAWSLISDFILSICEDKKGDLWVGTSNGLDKFDNDTNSFHHYFVKDGLPDETINAILADENDCLWLATDNGLSKFNTMDKSFRNYNDYDGLQNKEFHQSCYKNGKGEFFFCGVNGFNSFFPDNITDRENRSVVSITSFKILNSNVNLGKDISDISEIKLLYKQNSFSFDFSLLDYQNPALNQYAYRLENFEKDWIYSKNIRTAKYTNLEPGEYTFWVKAANSDIKWSEPVSVRIIISPPLWKTWWFYLALSVIILSGIISTVTELKKRKKRNLALETRLNERKSELEKINIDLQNENKTRQRIENSLRNSKEEYKLLVENANEAIVVIQEGKIVFTNSKLNQIIEYTTEELEMKSFLNFIHPDDRKMVLANYRRRLNNEDIPEYYTVRIIKKDSSGMLVEVNSVKMNWKDKPAILYFLSDITERKKQRMKLK
ncbi:MAG TPA: two-component regulator propeller domain-containing protein [Ignavibacteria bacterium]